MTVSAGFLATIVSIALAITLVATIGIVILWFRDWKRKKLW